MKSNGSWIERRLRVSGVLLILGLVVEAISLRWAHATAFLVFLFAGGLLMAVGIVLYLYSLVSTGADTTPTARRGPF